MDAMIVEAAEASDSARVYLAESGWVVTNEWQRDGDRLWQVFFAAHASYPQQRALSMTELVSRCTWQETHRTPRASR